MTPEMVLNLAQQGMKVTLFLAGPMLLAALSIGLLVSLFQAATQINEMTLSFIPKLLAMFLALTFAGPWMLQLMLDYISRLYATIPWIAAG